MDLRFDYQASRDMETSDGFFLPSIRLLGGFFILLGFEDVIGAGSEMHQ